MNNTKQAAELLLPLLFLLASAGSAVAGAPMPCVKAVSSASGSFLAITETQFEPADPHMPRTAKEVKLDIVPRERFINSKDRVTAPATFWDDWVQWSVLLNVDNTHPVPACPLALVTDDGEFLIVIGTDGNDWALRIYHRRDHAGGPAREGPDHGVLVRAVTLKELWPSDRVSEREHAIHTDESPQWFAMGSFRFSLDSRQLIYKTQWSSVARIDLTTGAVSKE